MRLRHRPAGGPHAGQARPHRAPLVHLMRLEVIEVAETHGARLHRDGARRERRAIQVESPLRAHDDSVEPRVFAGREPPPGQDIRGREICASATMASGQILHLLNKAQVARLHMSWI